MSDAVSDGRAHIAEIKAADAASPGSTLRGGDSIGVWEAGLRFGRKR